MATLGLSGASGIVSHSEFCHNRWKAMELLRQEISPRILSIADTVDDEDVTSPLVSNLRGVCVCAGSVGVR